MQIAKLLLCSLLAIGLMVIGAASSQAGSSPGTPVATGDLNGDGDTDIILEETSGLLFAWLMSGPVIDTSAGIATPPVGFELVAVGKANNDNDDDIFLQDIQGSNSVFVWVMAGNVISESLFVGLPPAGFQVIASGDFDGDGDADLLLEESGTGNLFIWFLTVSPGSVVIDASTSVGAPPAGFSVVGTGNFDATIVGASQTKSDILLQENTGLFFIWFMDGATITASQSVATPPAGFVFRATGDYDGDGNSDILLQEGVGIVFQWLMVGNTISVSQSVASPPGGIVVFNGSGNFDGKSVAASSCCDDILLQDNPAGPGTIFEWLLNSNVIEASSGVAAPPAGFSVINP